MTKLFGAGAILFVYMVLAFATVSKQQDKSEGQSCRGQVDNPTPQVRITTPKDGALVRGSRIPVEIETKDFEFAYDKATTPGTPTEPPEKYGLVPQEPNSGHVHVYLARYLSEGQVKPEKFFMVKNFVMPNRASFAVEDVEPGEYRLLVELVQHDHTSRIKHHPRDWPSLDMVTITVKKK